MIELVGVSKSYQRISGKNKAIFENQSVTIPMDKDVAILGVNGAGKSTLIKLIGGIEHPTSGIINSSISMGFPLGLGTGIQSKLTGRQNTAFVCNVYGVTNIDEAHEYVNQFSELGESYEDLVSTYSSGMKSRLAFSISILFNFDVILLDEVLSVGDNKFRKKCEDILAMMRSRGTRIILVSHSESTVRTMCQAGVTVINGQITYHESVDCALEEFNMRK